VGWGIGGGEKYWGIGGAGERNYNYIYTYCVLIAWASHGPIRRRPMSLMGSHGTEEGPTNGPHGSHELDAWPGPMGRIPGSSGPLAPMEPFAIYIYMVMEG
jgi:hypothetical protein